MGLGTKPTIPIPITYTKLLKMNSSKKNLNNLYRKTYIVTPDLSDAYKRKKRIIIININDFFRQEKEQEEGSIWNKFKSCESEIVDTIKQSYEKSQKSSEFFHKVITNKSLKIPLTFKVEVTKKSNYELTIKFISILCDEFLQQNDKKKPE